jgi:hypothetical protein
MKTFAALSLTALVALGAGISTLRAADDSTSGFSSNSSTQPRADHGITLHHKDKPVEATKGVTYGGIATDLYRKGPILFSPTAPKGTEAGKRYSTGLQTDGPAELTTTHTAQKPVAGGWNLFSVEF